MINLIKARWRHGYQAVKNIRKARIHEKYRGFPIIKECLPADARLAAKSCASGALCAMPLSLDMGKCSFCGTCARTSRGKVVSFNNYHYTATTSRGHLLITPGMKPEEFHKKAVECRKEIHRLFGRSFRLRSVSAGGCNACEMELNACNNVNFDMGRFGFEIAASPRHADGVIITGPVSENMAYALEETVRAVPEPKVIIAMGSCAISGGLFAESPAVNRQFFDSHRVDLFVPGCPPHPLTVINGILDFVGRR